MKIYSMFIPSTILWCVFSWKCNCSYCLCIVAPYVCPLWSVVIKLTLSSSLFTVMRESAWQEGIRFGSREKKWSPKSPGPSPPLMWGEWSRLVLAGLSSWQADSHACCWQRGRNAASQVCARQWRPTTKQLWCSFQKPGLYSQTACSDHGPVSQ